jgi:hypothetical protein
LSFGINFSGGVTNTGDPTQVTSTVNTNANAYGHGAFPVYWALNFFGEFFLSISLASIDVSISMSDSTTIHDAYSVLCVRTYC